jgi:SAM-dependent methyltransferase
MRIEHGGLAVQHDHDAGFLRLDPLPGRDEVAAYYDDDRFYSEHSPVDWLEKENREHAAGLWDSYYRYLWRNLRAQTDFEPVVYDIGCGQGHWVNWLGRNTGRNHFGSDPSSKALPSWVREPPKGRKVGALSFILVLEHLHDPASTILDYADRFLVSDGLLLVVVPNDNSPIQQVLEYKGWISQVHLNYFTPHTLSRLFHRIGFDVVWRGATCPLELAALLGYNYFGDDKRGRRVHNLRLRLEKYLGPFMFDLYKRLFDKYHMGRELIYIGRQRGGRQ